MSQLRWAKKAPRAEVMTFSIKAWTDGSAYHVTRQGGFCAIIAAMRDDVTEERVAELVDLASECLDPFHTVINDFQDDKLRARVSILRGYAINTTVNRMEMNAILASVEAMTKPCTMTIVSDSKFAIGAFTDWHVKANMDLVKRYREASKGFKIIFQHVHGHSGHPLNEWCDKLADYKGNPNLKVE